MLRFELLGRLRVVTDEGELAIGGRNSRVILACLVLHANERVSVDALVDTAWGTAPPPTAEHALQVYVSKLRRALDAAGERDRIENVAGGYQLVVHDGESDVDQFRVLAAEGRAALSHGTPERALQAFDAALALWRGGPLDDLAFEDVAQAAIHEFEELRLDTLEGRADALLALGRHADVARDLLAEVRSHPARERLVAALMLALYRGGRQREATALFQRHREYLAEELGLDPAPGVVSVHDQLLRQDPALVGSLEVRNELPRPATSFVGRQEELALAEDLLVGGARLLTLIGPGGVGKTRLAIELAASLRPRFSEVVFVELVSVSQPADVVDRIASAFRIPENAEGPLNERLASHLRLRRALIVLDNFEHLLEAVDVVESLVSRTDEPRFVVTSRTRLRLSGEYALPVPPLKPPPAGAAPDTSTPAVALFLERARAANPFFESTPAAIEAVSEVCRRVDGLPLAIELAAARSDVLSPMQLAELVGTDDSVLTSRLRDVPERHRSLTATLAWSVGFLSISEQRVLCRLAVVTGRFDLTMIHDVCEDLAEGMVSLIDIVSDLVDKSFIGRTTSDATEELFFMLETIRSYAQTRICDEDESEAAKARYVEHVRSIAGAASERLRGDGQDASLRALRARQDAVWGALAVACAESWWGEAAAVVTSLTQYWCMSGSVSEGRSWADRVMAHAGVLEPAELLRLKNACGQLAEYQSDFEVADSLHREVLDSAGVVDDGSVRLDALNGLAVIALWRGDANTSLSLSAEAKTLATASADMWRLQHILGNLAGGHYLSGDAGRAREELLEAVSINESIGNLQGRGAMLANLSVIAIEEEKYEDAAQFAHEARAVAENLGDLNRLASAASNEALACTMLGRYQEAGDSLRLAMSLSLQEGDKRVLASVLDASALLASRMGRDRDAATLYGSAAGISEALHLSTPPGVETEKEEDVRRLAEALGETTFEDAWAAGRKGSLESTLALAREIQSG